MQYVDSLNDFCDTARRIFNSVLREMFTGAIEVILDGSFAFLRLWRQNGALSSSAILLRKLPAQSLESRPIRPVFRDLDQQLERRKLLPMNIANISDLRRLAWKRLPRVLFD